MQFFVPAARDSKTAEAVCEAAKKHAKEVVGWNFSEKRFHRIKHRKGRVFLDAVVGEVYERTGELVLLILQSTGPEEEPGTFFICTWKRGIKEGVPIMVGGDSVVSVTEFEAN
ncbi:MAG: hypothetical protein FVQ81_08380 [Candidatus Glassbacteria bacterium]|nr:hypothetical protein [Candidatus Glassbacteria bacterium]